MPDASVRSLSVAADGEPLPFPGRVRLSGRDALSLFPALFTLTLWNLPDPLYLALSRCRTLSVSRGDACLAAGTVSDVYRQETASGTAAFVAFSRGLALWEARVSLSVPAGAPVSDTVARILEASGLSVPLLSFPGTDPVFSRPQAFSGRAAECVEAALSAASARAAWTERGLRVIPSGGLAPSMTLTEADLLSPPAFVGGVLRGAPERMILSARLRGWRPGDTVSVRYGELSAAGIIEERGIDADTGGGPWASEMVLRTV